MMMIGLPDFPKNPAIPIRLERDTAVKWRSPKKRIVGNLTVVKERAPLGQIAIETWRIWHLPGVDYLAVEIYKINFSFSIHRSE